MKEPRYSELVEKLNLILSGGGNMSPVSPTLRIRPGAGDVSTLGHPFIRSDMNIDSLNENELLLTHTLLHKFYGSGNNSLSRTEIKQLHTKVSNKICHSHFDKLDEDE